MKTAKKHQDRFFVGTEKLSEALGGEGSALGLTCSRRDAKAMIDDLTNKEFEVLAALLGHFLMLDEKFPTAEEGQRVREEVRKFFTNGPKTVGGISWKRGGRVIRRRCRVYILMTGRFSKLLICFRSRASCSLIGASVSRRIKIAKGNIVNKLKSGAETTPPFHIFFKITRTKLTPSFSLLLAVFFR